MSDQRVWYLAGALFLVAAVVSLVGESFAVAALLAVAGVLMLATPSYQRSKGNKRP